VLHFGQLFPGSTFVQWQNGQNIIGRLLTLVRPALDLFEAFPTRGAPAAQISARIGKADTRPSLAVAFLPKRRRAQPRHSTRASQQ